jgi:endonuclease/exonuclease/phosphatase family metal-dependent hydrolase
MVSRLTENNILRAAQVDTLAQMIAVSPYPTIVCGDFNDTPVSYTYRSMARNLRDAFRWAGRGYSHTYRGFFDMLRIDYVMCSDEFEPLSYEVIDSWTLEQTTRRRAGQRDTVLVRAFGNAMAVPTLDQAREAGERIEQDNTGEWIDNRVLFSDHYPVFVRLLYNGKTN